MKPPESEIGTDEKGVLLIMAWWEGMCTLHTLEVKLGAHGLLIADGLAFLKDLETARRQTPGMTLDYQKVLASVCGMDAIRSSVALAKCAANGLIAGGPEKC